MVRIISHWLQDLFRRHHRDAVRFAARLVGDRDGGEEVVQNVWLKLAARPLDGVIEHPKTYLFTATRNAAIDFTLRRQREWRYRVDMDDLDDVAMADDTPALYERRRHLARLAVYLNELPPACRQAFIMNKFAGYTHPEIAARLGISVSMVEKHVLRALLHCRRLLVAQGEH